MIRDLTSVLALLSLLCVNYYVSKNATQISATKATIKIDPNGYFRAENGLLFVKSDAMYLYEHVPSIINPSTGHFDMQPNNDQLKPEWKGQPYYVSRYDLVDGKWIRENRAFSDPPQSYLDFGPCDPFNQLDIRLQYPDVVSSVPASAKIKDIKEFDSQNYGLVVYSEPSSDPHPAYRLNVGLVAKTDHGWRVLETKNAGDLGWFCGTRTVQTTADGERATDLLVYTDEPAGSSNYIAIHSFLIISSEP